MGAARMDRDSVGRYELLIELAKGGMAELYVGRLRGVGGFARLVAIKRILPHLAEDAVFAEMFQNEGRIAARLLHTNVCQVHELGEADGELFLAMEYLEGMAWSELAALLPRDVQALRLAAGVIAQACEGLHYAHELRDLDGTPTPVVHRDVSPQNLFVTTDGTCKVLDFGIAKMLADGPRTRTGVLKGKLPYMSPEQIQGEPVDARSDVFALGVVLWEALTGRSLFDRETDFLIWKAITEAPIPPLAPFGFPPAIDAVIASALARDKERRFRSARALGEALRAAVEPVGGPCDASEIAALVRRHAGATLAQRQQELASAVARRSPPAADEPTAADTIEDHAGSTADLPPVRTSAGSTVRLRSDAKIVERVAPPSAAPPPPPPRSRAPWIIAGGVVLAGVIVAVAVTRAPTAPAAEPAAAPATADATAVPGLDGVDEQLAQARTALEAVGRMSEDGGLGKAMESVGKLAKWGRSMGAVRDSLHPTEPQGGLTVDSTPSATIFLDGEEVGETPYEELPVAVGTHELRAVLEDGRAQTKTIVIEASKTTDLGTLAW